MKDSEVSKRAQIARRDVEWLNRIRCGDHDALHQLFNAYFAELVAFARRQLRVPSEAPDVVQDVFASLWNRRGVVEVSASVASYLYGAVRLRSRDVRVHQVMVERYMVDSDDPAHESTIPNVVTVSNQGEARVILDEAARVIDAVVAQLPDRTQEVYRLSRYHLLSHREIAEVLGLSINTVNVQMSRSLRTIINALPATSAA